MSAGSNLRKAVEAEIPLQLVGTINESLLKVYKLLSIVRRLMSKQAPIWFSQRPSTPWKTTAGLRNHPKARDPEGGNLSDADERRTVQCFEIPFLRRQIGSVVFKRQKQNIISW
jgi:hypothetical protein